jgi:pimeloyl-ACP methyl ester carboxylesterase
MRDALKVCFAALALGVVAMAFVFRRLSDYELPDTRSAALAASLPFSGVTVLALLLGLVRCNQPDARIINSGVQELVGLLVLSGVWVFFILLVGGAVILPLPDREILGRISANQESTSPTRTWSCRVSNYRGCDNSVSTDVWRIMVDRVLSNGVELEVEARGHGEPVLLIHGGFLADASAPLLTQPLLTDRYQIIHYHRRGFAGSSRHAGPCSLQEQAADACAVLDHLGLERAHVAEHSYGGTIALQMVLDAPERVATLALLEPGGIPTPAGARFRSEVAEPTLARYHAGDKAGAVEAFLIGVCGPRIREVVDQVLPPGAFDLALTTDADTFFGTEFSARLDWRFGPEEAARITQPVLLVLGTESAAVTPIYAEAAAMLNDWLPQAELAELPGATHALQMMNATGMAKVLADFFARHPLLSPTETMGDVR